MWPALAAVLDRVPCVRRAIAYVLRARRLRARRVRVVPFGRRHLWDSIEQPSLCLYCLKSRTAQTECEAREGGAFFHRLVI